MLFKKKADQKSIAVPFPGKPAVLDCYSALFSVHEQLMDAIILPEYMWTENLFSRSDAYLDDTKRASLTEKIHKIESVKDLIPTAVGFAMSGQRTALYVDWRHLPDILGGLKRIARFPMPLVVYISASAAGGMEDLISVFSYGFSPSLFENFFVFHPKNLQEVIDYSIISHQVSERGLVPGICLLEPIYISNRTQWVKLPEKKFLDQFIGKSSDAIPGATPAQKLLFGDVRRRVPRYLDVDYPAGAGSLLDAEIAFKSYVGKGPYFSWGIRNYIDQELEKFATQTGRKHPPVSVYRWEDAEYGIVAVGTISEKFRAVVDHVRKQEKMPVGILSVNLLSPFPEAELSHYLKGKKAITILQQGFRQQEQTTVLGSRIRNIIQRGLEKGLKDHKDIHAGFASLEKGKDIPQIIEGIYGPLPRNKDLLAIVKNMWSPREPKLFFFAGMKFLQADMRFPILEMFQQQIKRNYPELEEMELVGTVDLPEVLTELQSIHLLSGDFFSNYFIGSLFSKAFSRALNWQVLAFPGENNFPGIHPSEFKIKIAPSETEISTPVDDISVLLSTRFNFLQDQIFLKQMRTGGIVLFPLTDEPQSFWARLTEPLRSIIRKRNLQIFTLNFDALLSDLKILHHNREEFRLLALLGAFLKINPAVSEKDFKRFLDDIRSMFEQKWGKGHPWVEQYLLAIFKGSELVQKMDWKEMSAVEPKPVVEPEVPWTVREAKSTSQTVFDITRTWETVGFLFESGRRDQALTDPALTSGILPARTSVFRDLSFYRDRIPRLIPENCTACGKCWAYCPESALPPTIRGVDEIFSTALQICEERNIQLTQLSRIMDHLVKQVYRVLRKDDLKQHRFINDLAQIAFEQLMEKMSPTEDQRKNFETEFQQLLTVMGNFPIVRTPQFFEEPEANASGSGKIFSMFINPQACKECGICVETCPEDALEMVAQDDRMLAEYYRAFQFYLKLPEINVQNVENYLSVEDPQTLTYNLFNKKVYHSLLGGDGAPAGSGVKTAFHLLLAAVETEMQRRVTLMVQKIEELINQLESKVQNTVSGSLKINDFEAFAYKLSRLEKEGIDLETLARLVSPEEETEQVKIDKNKLKRQTDLLNQLKTLRDKYLYSANGDGRSRLLASITADNLMLWNGRFPYNPYPFPWLFLLNEESAGSAEALFLSTIQKMADDLKLLRLARLEIDNTYDPREHEKMFADFSWQSFTEEEWALCPPVFFVGLTNTNSAGIYEAALRTLKKGYPIKIAIITTADPVPLSEKLPVDNPLFGTVGIPSDWVLSFLALQNTFVLQSTAGNAAHLMAGVMEGINANAPSFFHIYASEPMLHDIAPRYVIEQAEMSVYSRAFPVLKYNPITYESEVKPVDLSGNPDPEQKWATIPLKVKDENGIEREVQYPVTYADWAVQEGRYKAHFQILPRSKWHANMLPLHEYVELEKTERADILPYIEVIDRDGSLLRVQVSAAVVRASENRVLFWKRLQELAAIRPISKEMLEMKIQEAVEKVREETRKTVEEEYQQKISQLETNHQQIYQSRIAQKLYALSGFARDSESAKQTLKEWLQKIARSNGDTEEKKMK